MSQPHEWSFGTHRAWFEPPDVLWMEIHGETSLEDAITILEVYREVGSQQRFFLVTDLTDATTVDLKARDHVSWNFHADWFHSATYIGAGLMQRAVATSMSFFHSLTGQQTRPQHFVPTENDARALIAEERSLLDKYSGSARATARPLHPDG
ncbi:hypothetical protein BO221_47020 [Archangium sp. Cb G35]|uniref:hypothetical protein n=1 Tax=Archangium sp. Cb G35 TaxID=1920190 RepID=UPI0009375340|nr:hypothetical protein [Archangium sp. Cb G35]OJT16980.1 hypothetical protein BO221_47020 [Archangium sp. Cb G35]